MGTTLIQGATGYTGKLTAKSTVRSGSNAPDLRLLPELLLLAQSPRCAYYLVSGREGTFVRRAGRL